MALGRMPRGTNKLVKRIQRLAGPKGSSSDVLTRRASRSDSFAPLTEDDRLCYLTGRRSRTFARKSSSFGKLPRDIPQGCFAVYVGKERRRYVISTGFLSHVLFKQLLKKSEEEYGFEYEGGLNVVCDISLFEHLLWLIVTKDPAARTRDLEDIVECFYERSF